MIGAARATPEALPDSLGYRGFKVSAFPPFDELVVWRDLVVGTQSGRPVPWSDPERSLEGLLLESARAELDPALFTTIRALIDGP